jgi:lysozyme family protein
MSFANEARGRLTKAQNVLMARWPNTSDKKEQDAIDHALTVLIETRGLLNQAALLEAAAVVVDATRALEVVVRSARLAPFDDYVTKLEGALEEIGELLRNGEVGEHLERAPEPVVAAPVPTAPIGASPISPGSGPAAAASGPSTATGGGVSPPGNVSAPTTTTTSPTVTPTGSAPTPTTTIPTGDVSTPATANPPSTASTVGGAGLPPIETRVNFTALRSELDAWFNATIVRDECKDKVEWNTKQLLEHQSRYRDVGLRLNRVPWTMVGVIHGMECGFNFTCHLHNGDPLTNRTKHVPAGQPQTGTPPYSWENSAIDALTREGLNTVTDWSIPHMLYLLEKFNGFGYRKMGKPTPYLWSFSKLYEKGKYVADGRFDPEAVSKQCGAAVMIRALVDKGTDLSS